MKSSHSMRHKRIDEDKFKILSDMCRVICDRVGNANGLNLAGWDGKGEPEFTEDVIRFNGVIDDSGMLAHETFEIMRTRSGGHGCKTGFKPYNEAVVLCLAAACDIVGDEFKFTSADGDDVILGAKEAYAKMRCAMRKEQRATA